MLNSLVVFSLAMRAACVASADTARIVWIIALGSGKKGACTKYFAVGNEAVATPDIRKRNPQIVAPRPAIDG
jgi:hypothetical protein